jgi:predicted esterase
MTILKFIFVFLFVVSCSAVQESGRVRETLSPKPKQETGKGQETLVPKLKQETVKAQKTTPPLKPTQESSREEETLDIKSEVDLFLSTQDPDVENQVLKRLQSSKVQHETVKSILRARAKKIPGPVGLQTNLRITHNGKDYPYALFLPKSSDESIPLVVVLHGLGGSGANTIPAWVERLKRKVAVLCPTYPMGAWWAQPAEEMVLSLIDQIRENYNIDSDRVFLAGLSNGAIGAYMIGMFYPDRFAGLIPIAGSITPQYMHFLVNLRNTPVYMIQGAHDPIFPIELSRRIHKILSDMKYPVHYREHGEKGLAHGGHFLPESEVPAMVEWIGKQKRQRNPDVVRMTREGNHLGAIHWVRLIEGKNLALLELPGPESPNPVKRDGKIATLFASRKGPNQFEVMGQNIVKYDLYFNSETVDFDKPVTITTQKIQIQGNNLIPGEKKTSYQQKVEKDLAVLLYGYKNFRDPNRLYDGKVSILLESTIV